MKKKLKSTYNENHKKENEMLSKHGKVGLIKNYLEKNMLKPFKLFITRHHGGDLEENSIRILMKNGDDIFDMCLLERRK